jgi:hypothetical protein
MTQVGKVEGAQAAQTSIHDSMIHNQTGVNMGHVAQQVSVHDSTINNITGINTGHVAQQVSMHDSMIHNQTGVVEGQTAKTTSEADSYVNYEGHVFQVPYGAIDTYNSENVFTGYTLSTGQVITVAQMMSAAGDTTTSYDDVNLGRVEGAQAAHTSINDSTIHNITGINTGHVA